MPASQNNLTAMIDDVDTPRKEASGNKLITAYEPTVYVLLRKDRTF